MLCRLDVGWRMLEIKHIQKKHRHIRTSRILYTDRDRPRQLEGRATTNRWSVGPQAIRKY